MKILDNSSVSTMGRELRSLDLISRIKTAYDVRLPSAVITEYRGYKGSLQSEEINSIKVAVETNDSFSKLVDVIAKEDFRLGPGETEVMASSILLASMGVENYAIIDESLGRKIFKRILKNPYVVSLLGSNSSLVHLAGTVGMVHHLIQKGIITSEEGKEIAYELESGSFRITDKILSLIR